MTGCFGQLCHLSPFSTPLMDGTFPASLQKIVNVLAHIICRIFRACIAFGNIPTAWRHTKVIFIPKVGEDNCFEGKSFTPFSLTTFLLKIIEKLVNRYVRETLMGTFPLSDSQHAYRSGTSTNTALYCLNFEP